jgi:hypothetical protein
MNHQQVRLQLFALAYDLAKTITSGTSRRDDFRSAIWKLSVPFIKPPSRIARNLPPYSGGRDGSAQARLDVFPGTFAGFANIMRRGGVFPPGRLDDFPPEETVSTLPSRVQFSPIFPRLKPDQCAFAGR